MKRLIIDPRIAGTAGDMLLAALIDLTGDRTLLPELSNALLELDNCTALVLEAQQCSSCGLGANGLKVELEENRISDPGELRQVLTSVCRRLQLREPVQELAVRVLDDLVEAESRVHGGHVHLHEVGSLDTVLDIAGVLALMDRYGYLDGEIHCLPVAPGSGTVQTEHGIMPCPAPATLEVFKKYSMPMARSSEQSELTTPTGAALLANLADSFINSMPAGTVLGSGCGAGTRQLEFSPNLVRLLEMDSTGQTFQRANLLQTNVDDVTGEVLGHSVEALIEAGAFDAFVAPAVGKKGRPCSILSAVCSPDQARELSGLMMKLSGSLGVRVQEFGRYVAVRDVRHCDIEIDGRSFLVRYKVSSFEGEVINIKPEFDDICTIARELGLAPRIAAAKVAELLPDSGEGNL